MLCLLLFFCQKNTFYSNRIKGILDGYFVKFTGVKKPNVVDEPWNMLGCLGKAKGRDSRLEKSRGERVKTGHHLFRSRIFWWKSNGHRFLS
ncbi:hypothetical protein Peur_067699 [Populus x canadensis]